jgi:hypothetical protein
MQELKDIVMKNLAKDPIHYTKDGQFGVKGLGYTMDAPGLGEPKEPKGKYKSSGYGDLNEGIFDKFKSKPLGDVEGAKEDIKKSMIVFLQKNTNLKNADTFTDKELLKALEGFARHGEHETSSSGNRIANQLYKVAKPLFETDDTIKYHDGDEDEEEVKDVRDYSWTKGFTEEENKLREVIREIISKELEEVGRGFTTMESLKEGIEKEIAEINKMAEYEVLESKLQKLADAIEKRQSQLGKLDEDEDMKALTDKNKIKDLQKDIKTLEKTKAKLEKMMSKHKGKVKKTEVIDEDEDGYIKDADERQDDGQSIDSIVSTYTNLSSDEDDDLKDYLEDREYNS